MTAKHLSWIGYVFIVIGALLQLIGTFQSSIPLNTIGQIINMLSIPFTIWQSYRSTIESQQQFDQERQERYDGDQRVWALTNPGAEHIRRTKLLYDMGKRQSEDDTKQS